MWQNHSHITGMLIALATETEEEEVKAGRNVSGYVY
jgi:hypothetical protein